MAQIWAIRLINIGYEIICLLFTIKYVDICTHVRDEGV